MAASRSKSMALVHQRRGAPSQGQPEWWRAGQGAGPSENKNGQTDGCWCKIREQRIELSPRPKWRRAGSRAGQRSKEAKEEIDDPSQDQPKRRRSGTVNLFGLYLYLYSCLFGHPCPCLHFCPFCPLGGSILTFLGCNREKRSIMNLGRGIPFGSFGRAFARAMVT